MNRDPALVDAVRFAVKNKTTILARIRGIDRLDVLEKFLEVEVEREGGPRDDVVAALNQRKILLKEYGERPDRLEDVGAADRSDAPEKIVQFVEKHREGGKIVDVDVWDYDDFRRGSAVSKLHRRRTNRSE